MTADLHRDVIVRHECGAGTAERWTVFVGAEQRASIDSAERAYLFAKLLADLQQRPVWIAHASGEIERLDQSSLRGCSCC